MKRADRAAPLFRLRVGPAARTGLRVPSDVMVDKLVTVARGKVGRTIGRLDAETRRALDRLLAVFLGIAG